jgi:hypothetical protein
MVVTIKQITDTLGPQFEIARGDMFFQMLGCRRAKCRASGEGKLASVSTWHHAL